MPIYVFLANLTDRGVREVEDTTGRAQATDEVIKRHGGTTRDILWTQGRFEVVMTADAPDDEAASAISLAIARQGFLRIETLRAYDAAEVDGILGRLS